MNETVVMVVDDAPQSLGLLCHTLQESGYTVVVARDGESALERLDLVTPDVVLLDAVFAAFGEFDVALGEGEGLLTEAELLPLEVEGPHVVQPGLHHHPPGAFVDSHRLGPDPTHPDGVEGVPDQRPRPLGGEAAAPRRPAQPVAAGRHGSPCGRWTGCHPAAHESTAHPGPPVGRA